MPLFRREHLQFLNEYSWTATGGDDPTKRGTPDDDLLNRSEGYEVLYFINQYMENHGLTEILDGNKVESILYSLPSSCRSRRIIQAKIEDEWHNWKRK
jgi:hypothetical protein